jgi:N-acyl-D-amino-acid deacylase
MFDLVLRGGDIVDGSGAPAFRGDLAIKDGVIRIVGNCEPAVASESIDVTGLIVAPGFIDAHSHDDRYLFSEPDMPAKVRQGVTTVVTGNCGISLAPNPFKREVPAPLDILGDAGDFAFDGFADYLAHVDRSPRAANVYPLVGLTTIRVREVSELKDRATATEIEAMRSHCQAALTAGALGVSVGTFYPPAAAANNDEISGVAESLRDIGGVLAVHLRDETDSVLQSLDEAYSLAQALDAPLVLSHHKVAGIRNHGRSSETLRSIAKQRRTRSTSMDVYPYTASSTMLRASRVALAEKVVVTWSHALPQFAGQEISEIARALGCTIDEAIKRLQPAGATYHFMSQGDVDAIVCDDASMIGSDGLPHDMCPHPRLWGSFPRIFRCYVRERPLLTLPQAVYKMTGLTASRFGIATRGVLKAGMQADICVFDPTKIADRSTFEHPTQPPIGIEHVICNGQFTLRDGKATGARPGQRTRPIDCALRRKP